MSPRCSNRVILGTYSAETRPRTHTPRSTKRRSILSRENDGEGNQREQKETCCLFITLQKKEHLTNALTHTHSLQPSQKTCFTQETGAVSSFLQRPPSFCCFHTFLLAAQKRRTEQTRPQIDKRFSAPFMYIFLPFLLSLGLILSNPPICYAALTLLSLSRFQTSISSSSKKASSSS